VAAKWAKWFALFFFKFRWFPFFCRFGGFFGLVRWGGSLFFFMMMLHGQRKSQRPSWSSRSKRIGSMCISFDAGRICLGPRRRFHFRMNFSVRKGCNICRIVRVSHYSEMLTITTLPLLLLASGWFWSPRPRTSVKSGNSLVFPSADIRRHVTACKVAVFLRRGHPQTQRHVISKHFALVRRHPQTSAQRGSKVRRHPQTSADNEFSQLRKICDAIIQLLLRHP